MKLKQLVVGVALAAGLSSASFAALNVGTVDLTQLLQTAPQIVSMSDSLKKEFAPAQQNIMTAQKNLQAEMQSLSQAANTKMTADQQTQLKNKIMADQKNLQQMVVTYQQNVSTAQQKALNTFMGEVSAAAKTIATKDNLDVVLLKPTVIYSANTTDITSQILADLPKS